MTTSSAPLEALITTPTWHLLPLLVLLTILNVDIAPVYRWINTRCTWKSEDKTQMASLTTSLARYSTSTSISPIFRPLVASSDKRRTAEDFSILRTHPCLSWWWPWRLPWRRSAGDVCKFSWASQARCPLVAEVEAVANDNELAMFLCWRELPSLALILFLLCHSSALWRPLFLLKLLRPLLLFRYCSSYSSCAALTLLKDRCSLDLT
ncbi:unnamed protein product [Fusarium venenatum]|uniref:Uncharacterized protein n=1 Tax=Fusarium venenatum TaxID=56646 RepID=A0A2L2T7F6_9HYPO|nr:uncharacterized protein FVRRES_05517 [Fusarium venenatum]CEI61081.1 unnamed protein product [Fusarium venenatum]